MWNNLRDNHAGFPHICKLLRDRFPSDYTVITDYVKDKRPYVSNHLVNRCINSLDRRYHSWVYDKSIKRMMAQLRDDDEVFLMEYLHHDANQIELAKAIRRIKPKVRIYGLAHLTPSALERCFMPNDYALWAKPIDAILTLGSSLSAFLLEKTNHSIPVYTLFHPVDESYYHHLDVGKSDVTVIALGNLQRNYSLLDKVVKELPNIKFILCSGFADCSSFKKYPNTTVYGYLPEPELRKQLSKADISLNVMDDTVGSNVITISMAMHLALVVSDVGSIRDYCTNDNAFFCNNPEEFVAAIRYLDNHREVLEAKKQASSYRVKQYSVERFHYMLNDCLSLSTSDY